LIERFEPSVLALFARCRGGVSAIFDAAFNLSQVHEPTLLKFRANEAVAVGKGKTAEAGKLGPT
jgi:hypothetical protein